VTTTSVTGGSAATSTVPVTVGPSDSSLQGEISSVLAGRSGTLGVAVQNMVTGVTWSFGSATAQDEASVVKVNILATLLASDSGNTSPLSASQKILAAKMIEESDNDAATTLWSEVGGSKGIGAFNRSIGLTSTVPSPCLVCANFPWPGWGLTTSTPLDQLRLLKSIFFASANLSPADRAYILQLMTSVVPAERWGVSAGVPANASVALKNGWLPLNAASTDWQINSIGWVTGDGRNYLVALFSTGNPSEDYGIQTLDTVSKLIWQYLGLSVSGAKAQRIASN